MSLNMSLVSPYSVQLLLPACALYLLSVVTYRLFLHPLRRYPGPKLAATTSWYCAYYNIVRGGGLPDHLNVLHEIYGPVVRLSPNELHFADANAYWTIYASGSKFTKDPHAYAQTGVPLATVGLIDPHAAKVRRDLLGALFSRRAILKRESLIHGTVDELISNLKTFADSSQPVNMLSAYRCVALDTITSWAFGVSVGALKHKDFKAGILDSIDSAISLFWIFERLPWFSKLIFRVPTAILPPNARRLVRWREQISKQVDAVIADPTSLERDGLETMYHHIYVVRPEKGQYEVPSKASLCQEAEVMFGAGSETSASICFVATFQVLQNPNVYLRLTEELMEAFPDVNVTPIRIQSAEKLPYLTAVLKEALRIKGAVSPLRRRAPCDIDIAGCSVPKGTTVSVASHFLQYNETVFPDPYRFNPDRWLGTDTRKLEEYFVPFSKGPRMCLGLNLAWCEVYLIISNVFRRLDLKLENPKTRTLKCRDYTFPHYNGDEARVRISVPQM